MQAFIYTVIPMLIIAGIVMVSGERLSREESAVYSPYDREQVLDFSSQFSQELRRLDTLFQGHLDRITGVAKEGDTIQLQNAAQAIISLQSIKIFHLEKENETLSFSWPSEKIPEIKIEGEAQVLKPSSEIFLPKDIFIQKIPTEGLWLDGDDTDYKVYCQRLRLDGIMVCLFDYESIREQVRSYLQSWLAAKEAPQVDHCGGIEISFAGESLWEKGVSQLGPAAAIIPYRSFFGEGELRAWDQISIKHSRNMAVIAITVLLTCLILAAGIYLYLSLRNVLHLAAQRVSFVNQVSHELGSPLTNILLNLDLAIESLDNNLPKSKSRLNLVTEEVERLSRLVANVLTFSQKDKNATPSVSTVSIDITRIIRDVLESSRPSLERRHITIESQMPTSLLAVIDVDMFRQILGNLLSNVEKYAASGKWVSVCLKETENDIILDVSDRGQGVSLKDAERIFKSFERINSDTTGGVSGTGLGLSIGQELALRMGGSLKLLESDPTYQGAVFRLRLPKKRPGNISKVT